MVYFSQLKGSPVYDSRGKYLGKLHDLSFVDGGKYAEITHIIYTGRDKYKKKLSWRVVKEFKETRNKSITIFLNLPEKDLTPFFPKSKEVLVGDILDKQVIDVNGVKIVRINDIVLGKVKERFFIVAVGVGTKSFLRRIGFKNISKVSNIKENIIPWKSVERLEPELHDLHLKIQKDKIADLHPEDIADIMEDLSHNERILIFNSLNREKAARTIIEAETNVQDSLLKSWKLERVKDLLENIPYDQAADILSLMPDDRSSKILKSMRKSISSKIKKILNYHPESAGAIMKTDYIAVPDSFTAQKTIDYLRKLKPSSERIYHIYVVDKNKKFKGVLSIRLLLTAQPRMKVTDIMETDVIYVHVDTPKEDIAKAMARYDLFVLPVIDQDKALKGIVLADDVLTEVIPKRWKKEKYRPYRTS